MWIFLKEYAKENRRNLTEAEEKLWQEIRNRKIANCKFRRQHPIAGYIPDFVCLEAKLIVEIDGEYHDEEKQQQLDKWRTAWLENVGYRMLRFSNDEVLNNISFVLQNISTALAMPFEERNQYFLSKSSIEV